MSLHHIEKQTIKVTLQMKITFGEDTESYEFITLGTSMHKGSDLYLQYSEESEAGTTKTTLSISQMKRFCYEVGRLNMRQLFVCIKRQMDIMKVAYGMLGLWTTTSKLSMRGMKSKVGLTLHYELTYARQRGLVNMI